MSPRAVGMINGGTRAVWLSADSRARCGFGVSVAQVATVLHEHEKARDPVDSVAEEGEEQLDVESGNEPAPAAAGFTPAQHRHPDRARPASPPRKKLSVSDEALVPESRCLVPGLLAAFYRTDTLQWGTHARAMWMFRVCSFDKWCTVAAPPTRLARQTVPPQPKAAPTNAKK